MLPWQASRLQESNPYSGLATVAHRSYLVLAACLLKDMLLFTWVIRRDEFQIF